MSAPISKSEQIVRLLCPPEYEAVQIFSDGEFLLAGLNRATMEIIPLPFIRNTPAKSLPAVVVEGDTSINTGSGDGR